jgi:hypothetical protein
LQKLVIKHYSFKRLCKAMHKVSTPNKRDKTFGKSDNPTNRTSASKARKSKSDRSGTIGTSTQHAEDSKINADQKETNLSKEILHKKSLEAQEAKLKDHADLAESKLISTERKVNNKQKKVSKPINNAIPSNVDMNEVDLQQNFPSSGEMEDGAPEEDFIPDLDLMDKLDDEDENYKKVTNHALKRPRSVARTEQMRSGRSEPHLGPEKRTRDKKRNKMHRQQSIQFSVSSDEGKVKQRLARLENLIRLQALKNLGEHVSEDEERYSENEEYESGDDIPPCDEEMSDEDDDENGSEDSDQADEDDSTTSDGTGEGGREEHSVLSRRMAGQLTSKGKAAKEVLEEHYGDQAKFHPLTHSISRSEREAIVRGTTKTEPFFSRIRKIEIPFKYSKWTDKDKEKKLYKQMCRYKDMYEIQMTMLYDIVNGEQQQACRHLLQMVDLTLDAATITNLERLSLRSGPSVVQSIRHAEEEAVFQDPYKAIITAKAKEAQELRTMAGRRFFQPGNTRLRKWGTLRRGWDTRTPRSGLRGSRDPPQSRSRSSGDYPRSAATHQSVGRWASEGRQRDKNGHQPGQAASQSSAGRRKN